jgi:flavin reductase (DIM6/NTAB) family NADH-FMN oxidoreductase RutF
MDEPTTTNEEAIKDVLKRLPYGFYSITSRNGDEVNAMVANWVMQASFTPRLVVLGLATKSYSYEVISAGRVFGVNLFNKGDEEAMMPFTKARAKRPDKMDNADYTPGPVTGVPILAGAAAYLECRVVNLVNIGGDHDLLVGEVVNAGILKPGEVTDTLTLPHVGWSYAG